MSADNNKPEGENQPAGLSEMWKRMPRPLRDIVAVATILIGTYFGSSTAVDDLRSQMTELKTLVETRLESLSQRVSALELEIAIDRRAQAFHVQPKEEGDDG